MKKTMSLGALSPSAQNVYEKEVFPVISKSVEKLVKYNGQLEEKYKKSPIKTSLRQN